MIGPQKERAEPRPGYVEVFSLDTLQWTSPTDEMNEKVDYESLNFLTRGDNKDIFGIGFRKKVLSSYLAHRGSCVVRLPVQNRDYCSEEKASRGM